MTPEQIRRFNDRYRKIQKDDYSTGKKGIVRYKPKRKKTSK